MSQTAGQIPTVDDFRIALRSSLKHWLTSPYWYPTCNSSVARMVQLALSCNYWPREVILGATVEIIDSRLSTSAGRVTPWREGINCMELCGNRTLVSATGYDYNYHWLLLRDLALLDVYFYKHYRPYLSWIDIIEINATCGYQSIEQLLGDNIAPPSHPSIHFMIHPRSVRMLPYSTVEDMNHTNNYTMMMISRVEGLLRTGDPLCLVAAYMLRPNTVETFMELTGACKQPWVVANIRWISWHMTNTQQGAYTLTPFVDYRSVFSQDFARGIMGSNLYASCTQ